MPDLARRIAERYLQGSGRTAVAPPGWEHTVKEMKKNPEIDNPWALAWSMENKGNTPGGKEAGTGFTQAYYAIVDALRELRDRHHMDPHRIALQAVATLEHEKKKT